MVLDMKAAVVTFSNTTLFISSSFDKMANEAEMLARIERKGFQR